MGDFSFTATHAHLLERAFVHTGWTIDNIIELKSKESRGLLRDMKKALQGYKTIVHAGPWLEQQAQEDTVTEVQCSLMAEVGLAFKHAGYSREDIDQLLQHPRNIEYLLFCLIETSSIIPERPRFDGSSTSALNTLLDVYNFEKQRLGEFSITESDILSNVDHGNVVWNRTYCHEIPLEKMPYVQRPTLEVRRSNRHAEQTYGVRQFYKKRKSMTIAFLAFFIEYPYLMPKTERGGLAFAGPTFMDNDQESCFVYSPRWQKKRGQLGHQDVRIEPITKLRSRLSTVISYRPPN